MEAVSLPLLNINSSVHEALSQLRAMGRGAVVVESGPAGSYRLIDAKQLLEARNSCIQLLSGIAAGDPVKLIEPADVAAFVLDTIRPLNSWVQYENWFSQRPENYGLVGADSEIAMVVTRHEGLK